MTTTLDNTFGGDGIVTTDFSGDYDYGRSVTVQSDGKILVAGDTNDNFGLVRYNTDGSLDNSFGNNGKVNTENFDDAMSVTVQSDGKILVAGVSLDDFGLVRYNTDGSLDNSFDNDGKVNTNFSGYDDYANSVTIQSDGKILVAGLTFNSVSGYSNFGLVRYNTDGSLDNSFDNDGKVNTDFAGFPDSGNSVTVQSDGKILVAGDTGLTTNDNGYDFGLVRYNTDGSLDNSFDNDGKVTTDFSGYQDFGKSVTVQSDGKILVAGDIGNDSDYSNFGLVRYNTDGSLDNSFGTGGKYSVDIGDIDFANSVTVQSDGKIVVAGSTDNGNNNDFAVIRLNNITSSNRPTTGADKIIGTAGNDTIDGLAGNDTISGVGGNDRLLGSAGDDSINGGAGDDTMIGGPGNDNYIVNSVRDRVVEALNAGTDRIFSTVTYTLPANVENLTLQGTQAINGTGNGLPNRIIGNSVANRINGGGGNDILNGGGGNDILTGGAGNDNLTGGTGADRFLYNTNATFTRASVGVDTITDFAIGQNDKIVLDKTTFRKITSANGTGFSINAEFAKVNTDAKAAISGADIVYNTATGALFYNQNGTATGFGTGGKFAILSNKPGLTENQFIIQA